MANVFTERSHNRVTAVTGLLFRQIRRKRQARTLPTDLSEALCGTSFRRICRKLVTVRVAYGLLPADPSEALPAGQRHDDSDGSVGIGGCQRGTPRYVPLWFTGEHIGTP